jgi:hypothetical protein
MASLVPCTTMSRMFGVRAVMRGFPMMALPRLQPDHEVPSNERWHSPRSERTTTTSTRFAPQETALQLLPFHERCCSVLSRTRTENRNERVCMQAGFATDVPATSVVALAGGYARRSVGSPARATNAQIFRAVAPRCKDLRGSATIRFSNIYYARQLLIDADTETADCWFSMSRSRSKRPWLRIATALLLSFGAARASAATRVLAPSDDTFINSASPGNNNGGSSSMFTGADGHGGAMRALIRFDLPSELQGRVTVTNVRLGLTVETLPNNTVGAAVETLQALTQAWLQGNGVGNSPGSFTTGQACGGSISGATWNQSSCTAGINWTTPGATVAGAISGQLDTSGVPAGGVATWDSAVNPAMNADVQSWIDLPAGNQGWRISSNTENITAAAQRFFASEAGSSTAPTLAVTYSCKPGFVESGVQCLPAAVPVMGTWGVVLLALSLMGIAVVTAGSRTRLASGAVTDDERLRMDLAALDHHAGRRGAARRPRGDGHRAGGDGYDPLRGDPLGK